MVVVNNIHIITSKEILLSVMDAMEKVMFSLEVKLMFKECKNALDAMVMEEFINMKINQEKEENVSLVLDLNLFILFLRDA